MKGNRRPIFFFDQRVAVKRRVARQSAKKEPTIDRSSGNAEDVNQEDLTNNGTNVPDRTHILELNESFTPQKQCCDAQESRTEVGEKLNCTPLIEEYRRQAPQVLADLGALLCRYAQCGHEVFPRGLVNILNYTWKELTADSRPKAADQSQQSTARMSKPQRDRRPGISSSKCRGSTQASVVRNEPLSRSKGPLADLKHRLGTNSCKARGPPVCTTIGFAMSSAFCEDPEWIVQPKYATPTDPQWTSLCRWVVDRLQQAQKPTDERVALLLCHYGDSKRAHRTKAITRMRVQRCVVGDSPPNLPVPSSLETVLHPKLHYRLPDGTSVVYYPSGRVAVCHSPSGHSTGGFYTNVFSDTSPVSVLATVTAFGHGAISCPQSGGISVVWDQSGGMALDLTGTVERRWRWCPGKPRGEPINIEVSEGITVRLCSPNSAVLMFKAKHESVQLSLSFLSYVDGHSITPKQQTPSSPPSVSSLAQPHITQKAEDHTEEDASQCHGDHTEIECIAHLHRNRFKEDSEVHHVGPCPVQELRRLRRRVRRVLERWLQHYRMITGICQPVVRRKLEPVCRQSSSHMESAPLPSLVISAQKQLDYAQPNRDSGCEQSTRPNHAATCTTVRCLVAPLSKTQCLTAPLKAPKEEPQHITDTGIVRVHSNIKLESILVPWLPPNWQPSPLPHDPFGCALPCPAVLRAALRGEEGWQSRRCHCRSMPTVTDVEYDALVAGQGCRREQVLVMCITAVRREGSPTTRPSRHEEALEQLYTRMNRKRNMPCTQCQTDSFRLLKHEVPGPEDRMAAHKTLLQQRHGVAPDMFLLYLRGRLLFANYIFTDDRRSVRDIQKQVAKARRDYRLCQFLPPDFKCRYLSSTPSSQQEVSPVLEQVCVCEYAPWRTLRGILQHIQYDT